MKKTQTCTKEKTLSAQLNERDRMQISEIVLSDMSKNGNLRILDMNDVTELNTDDLEEDGSLDCYPFYFDNHLEEVILPNSNAINYPMFYECKSLSRRL